jgi:hypothetical protein
MRIKENLWRKRWILGLDSKQGTKSHVLPLPVDRWGSMEYQNEAYVRCQNFDSDITASLIPKITSPTMRQQKHGLEKKQKNTRLHRVVTNFLLNVLGIASLQ